jgi:TorA maturation chaperone TorD
VTVDIQEFIAREKARCDCFRILAACFYQPERSIFLEEKTLESLSSHLGRVCPDAGPFAVTMKEAMLACSSKDLLIEYSSLFVGPTELMAAPYGSVYLEEGRKVMGDSTVKVMDYYRKNGLIMDNDFKELPDHIAVELEFMYFLTFREVEALKKGETDRARHFMDVQGEFSERFMRPWVPVFCDKIRQGTDNPYYQSLAGCLSVFIDCATGTFPVFDESMKITGQV